MLYYLKMLNVLCRNIDSHIIFSMHTQLEKSKQVKADYFCFVLELLSNIFSELNYMCMKVA